MHYLDIMVFIGCGINAMYVCLQNEGAGFYMISPGYAYASTCLISLSLSLSLSGWAFGLGFSAFLLVMGRLVLTVSSLTQVWIVYC